jgi:hypothetical protein
MDEGVVKFYCPKCRQKLSAATDDVGQTIQCPVCNTLMRVPRIPPQPAPELTATPEPAPEPEPAPAAEKPTRTMAPVGAAPTPPSRARSVPNWAMYAAGAVVLLAATVGGLALFLSSRSGPQPPSETWKDLPPPPPPRALQTPADRTDDPEPSKPPRTVAKADPALSPRTARPVATVVPPRTSPKPPPVKAEPPTASATVDLPVAERKKIFAELMEADADAAKSALEHFPDEPMFHLVIGDRFLLSRGVPLLPARPPDGASGVKNGGTPVRAGVTLEIVDVKPGTTAPWYQVRSGADAGSLDGWIDAVSLAGQSRTTPAVQATKRRDFQAQQLRELREAIGTKYKLTSEQIAGVFAEGIENWQSDATTATAE